MTGQTQSSNFFGMSLENAIDFRLVFETSLFAISRDFKQHQDDFSSTAQRTSLDLIAYQHNQPPAGFSLSFFAM